MHHRHPKYAEYHCRAVCSGFCLPDNVIQHVSVNGLNTGRNADEVMRTLRAIKAGGLTGCNWQPGEDFVA